MFRVRVTELGLLGCGVRIRVRFMELGLSLGSESKLVP